MSLLRLNVRVVFVEPLEWRELDLAALDAALRNPEALPESSSLAYLGRGLLAAATDRTDNLECHLERQQGSWSLDIRDEGTSHDKAARNRNFLRFTCIIGRRPGDSFLASLRRRVADHAAEHREVALRCRWSPVPVSLDGVRVDGKGWLRSDFPPGTVCGLPDGFLLAERYLVASDQNGGSLGAPHPSQRHYMMRETYEGLSTEEVRDATSTLLLHQCRWASAPDQPVGVTMERPPRGSISLGRRPAVVCHAVVAVPAVLVGPTRLVIIKAGVALDPVSTYGMVPGACIAFGGEGIRTDLTGLQPVYDETLQERLTLVAEQLRQLCSEVARHLVELPSRDYARGGVVVATVAGAVFGGLLLGGLGLTAAGLGALGLGTVGANLGFGKKRRLDKEIARLRRRLEDLSLSDSTPVAEHT